MDKIRTLGQRIKTNFKKNKVATIVLILIWVITIIGTLFFYGNTLGKQSYGNDSAISVAEIYDGKTIKGTLPVYDGSESVCIKLATYARKNKGLAHIEVMGNNTRTIYLSKDINTNTIEDNAFLSLELDKTISSEKEQFVTVSITTDNPQTNSIGVYYSPDKVFEMSELTLDGEVLEGDLGVRFLTYDEQLELYYKILISWAITGLSFLVLFLLLIEPKIHVFFAVMTAIVGITFCFLMTPLSIPDEFAHYEYSLQVSNYMMFKEDHLSIDTDYRDYGQYRGHFNVSSAYKKIVKRFNHEYVPDGIVEEMDNDVADIYKLCFVPQSIGVTIGRLLNFNRIKLFFLGRLFNLSFYVACIYMAVKKTPIHKLLFGIIATLPMFMQQAASYSYDCFINGLTFITAAYLLRFIFAEEKIKNKELIFVLIVNALLAPAKIVYGFFSFLFLFVPSKNYGSKSRKALWSILLFLPATYQIVKITKPVLVKVFKNMSELYIDPDLNLIVSGEFGVVKEKITVGYMVRNPGEAFMLFYRTIRYSIKNWVYDTMGRSLAGVSLILPVNLVHLLVVAPIASAFVKEVHVESAWLKACFILVCAAIGIYVMGGFILSWTDMSQAVVDDYGGIIVQGIQGRYFCPLLPFAFSIFNNKKLAIPQKFNKYIIYTQLIVIFEVVVYVLSYTFVN